MQQFDAPVSGTVLVRTLGAILQHAHALTASALTCPHCGTVSDRLEISGADPLRDGRSRSVPDHLGRLGPRPVEAVYRGELSWGDSLFVTTRNSVYCINPAGRDWFVWGGWFERAGHTPAVVGINGCTWGGTVIHSDILAAPGLFLEFSNGVTTTRIRDVFLVPSKARSSV